MLFDQGTAFVEDDHHIAALTQLQQQFIDGIGFTGAGGAMHQHVFNFTVENERQLINPDGGRLTAALHLTGNGTDILCQLTAAGCLVSGLLFAQPVQQGIDHKRQQ